MTSCIPVKVAPKFKNEDYKIIQAKKFKRKLSRETSFIFKDPKNEGEFYKYLNTKFQLKDNNVGLNTPFKIKGETFYLTYSETEKEDKSVNLPLVLIDVKRESNGNNSLFESHHINRTGHWYLLLTVYDKEIKNCLLDNHPKRENVIEYLKSMKAEYLNTANYQELLFNKKP
ncbi:hypothetical protein GCM10011444_17160 [Winogradskyella haliclonae]|uniref:Lipoprotein n=2 Tax=Winogradskyella haliclonae TaxID=2048558 RepID=A0ABQ2BY41_9FLAO|nr:hypothetical protein GCM10011444_17160 [Winogradskyella haliclonae]